MNRWSDKEIEFIKNHYENSSKEHILDVLQSRTWDAIRVQANKFGLKRSFDFVRNGTVARLLDEDHVSMYWLGFLFADGHFRPKEISLMLGIKDLDHMEKFSQFFGGSAIRYTKKTKNRCEMCRTSVGDKSRTQQIMKRYGIKTNKTINPVDTSKLSVEQLLSVIVGFIDGDGNIYTRSLRSGHVAGRIACHENWLSTFLDWRQHTSSIINSGSAPRLIKNNKCFWSFSGAQLRQIKSHALLHNLPIMKRKWDMVTESNHKYFSDEEIRFIRETSLSISELISIFDVDVRTIKKVLTRATYKNVLAVDKYSL